MSHLRSKTLIAVGGNLWSTLGAPAQTIVDALPSVAASAGAIRSVSRFFRTPCFPAGAGPDYVNAAFCLETALSPEALLAALHETEARYGRARTHRWAGRTLDLDVLSCGDAVLPDAATVRRWIALPPDRQMQQAPERLLLPHPRLQDRAFVLVPLMDIAPDWRHPLTGRTVAAMHAALPEADRNAVIPL